MTKLGILISGRGSNMVAIHEAIQANKVDAEIAVVISNKPDAQGLEIAAEFGLKTVAIPPKHYASMAEYEQAVGDALRDAGVEWVILAGYMRILGREFIRAFEGRILNIHPSLLPRFKGLNAQRQAIKAGVKEAGCSVHFVVEELDSGPIILQKKVPVMPGDDEATLSSRILVQEHIAYPKAIQRVIKGES